MENARHTASIDWRHWSATGLACVATGLWVLSLFGPTPFDVQGAVVLIGTVLVGWTKPELGPWAVLANVTILVAAFQIVLGRWPRWSLPLSVGLPATSPAYWESIGRMKGAMWGEWAWNAAILVLLVAGLVARPCKGARTG